MIAVSEYLYIYILTALLHYIMQHYVIKRISKLYIIHLSIFCHLFPEDSPNFRIFPRIIKSCIILIIMNF